MPSIVITGLGRRLVRLPAWASAALVGLLLIGCTALVYGAGGTRTAYPHVFYVPIVLAALPFGVGGGLVAAVFATVLCGPLMPLDTATGDAQEIANWLVRGGFFAAVGALSGVSTVVLRRGFEAGLSERLRAELEPEHTSEQSDMLSEAAVSRVIADRAFHPVFQPIYGLDDGRLVAVEALTRFDTVPELTPDLWFNRAAQLGIGVDLELAAVEAALEASSKLPSTVAMTFNGSPQLLCDERLHLLLDEYHDRPLIAEVTEHAAVDDYRQLTGALASLRSRGVELAVDDAGAGFASLRHIVSLGPDYIKLDPSLTQNLGNDPIRRPLADALIQFARRTGSAIIVEGIERQADLATWKDLGAHAAQGYLLGKPAALPVAEHTSMLTSTRQLALSHVRGVLLL